MSFTKEEALKYHREMWGKIREECGNNATNSQRFKVKKKGCDGFRILSVWSEVKKWLNSQKKKLLELPERGAVE